MSGGSSVTKPVNSPDSISASALRAGWSTMNWIYAGAGTGMRSAWP
jgi:hypothetical protein